MRSLRRNSVQVRGAGVCPLLPLTGWGFASGCCFKHTPAPSRRRGSGRDVWAPHPLCMALLGYQGCHPRASQQPGPVAFLPFLRNERLRPRATCPDLESVFAPRLLTPVPVVCLTTQVWRSSRHPTSCPHRDLLLLCRNGGNLESPR